MVEREVIRRIIIEGQEFVSITSMKLFISILTMSASDK